MNWALDSELKLQDEHLALDSTWQGPRAGQSNRGHSGQAVSEF